MFLSEEAAKTRTDLLDYIFIDLFIDPLIFIDVSVSEGSHAQTSAEGGTNQPTSAANFTSAEKAGL